MFMTVITCFIWNETGQSTLRATEVIEITKADFCRSPRLGSSKKNTKALKKLCFLHNMKNLCTVFPRFSAPGSLPIFEVFGGALIKTYENLDLPFPAHTRTLFIIYDN